MKLTHALAALVGAAVLTACSGAPANEARGEASPHAATIGQEARSGSSSHANAPVQDAASPYAAAAYWGQQEAHAPARSPVSLEELELLKETVLLGPEDLRWLRASRAVLEPEVEAILDVWYGFVGANPHLLASFTNRAGEPQGDYLAAVRTRFGRWILDTADARFDQDWLDYQHEIAKRHHRTKKNAIDGADAAPEVAFRYLVALHQPITTTLRPFLEQSGRPAQEVDRMQDAWRKAVLLQVILWSHPYVREGSF